ncbi:hypothetical protein D3C76_879760 [compost metagenome]
MDVLGWAYSIESHVSNPMVGIAIKFSGAKGCPHAKRAQNFKVVRRFCSLPQKKARLVIQGGLFDVAVYLCNQNAHLALTVALRGSPYEPELKVPMPS